MALQSRAPSAFLFSSSNCGNPSRGSLEGRESRARGYLIEPTNATPGGSRIAPKNHQRGGLGWRAAGYPTRIDIYQLAAQGATGTRYGLGVPVRHDPKGIAPQARGPLDNSAPVWPFRRAEPAIGRGVEERETSCLGEARAVTQAAGQEPAGNGVGARKPNPFLGKPRGIPPEALAAQQ